ncbi:MAG TPA: PAS domain-containing protein [Ramlibacter sp.]|nr:PAS domain-containing protein [Ramlibacter sp.]
MLSLLTVRARLLALLAAAALPLVAAAMWAAVSEGRTANERAQGQLRVAASLMAAQHDRLADSTEHLLTAIAAMPDMRAPQRERCQGYFETLRGRYPLYLNMGIMNLHGDVICHAGERQGPLNLGDRDYFIDAARTGRFAMGDMVIGRITHRAVLPFGLPIVEGGQVRAVAFATLDLARIQAELARTPQATGVRLMLADQQGRVLVEGAAAVGAEPGRVLEGARLQAAVRSLQQQEMTLPGANGEDRLYALAPTVPIGERRLMGIASIDSATLTAQAWDRALQQLGIALAVVLGGLLAAWGIGVRMITGPAGQVLAVARRLQEGDLAARLPLPRAGAAGEFEQIAGALNQMADALQLRQRELEAELRNSKSAHAVLDSVLDNMREGVMAVTASGRVLIHNTAASRVFPSLTRLPRRRQPQALGIRRGEGAEPLAPEELPLERAIAGESGQMQLLAPDADSATERLLQCSFQPLPSEQGEAAGLLVFSDVTQLHQLQQEQARQLAQAKVDRRKLMDAQRIGRIGYWERDFTTGRITWSDEVYAIYGAGLDEFDGTPRALLALAHPDDRSLVARQLRSQPSDGGFDTEYRVQRKDGADAWVRVTAEVQQGDDGQARLYGVVQDITAQKLGEAENARLLHELGELNLNLERRIEQRTAELAQQEARYRILAEQAPEVIWNADAQGRATYFNRAVALLFGGEPADWLGHAWLSRLHPDDVEPVMAAWKLANEELRPFVGTRRCKAIDGSWHTFHFRAEPLFDEQGQLAMWLGVDTDISELKTIESELRASNRELEAFSYSVSHDLRSPLAAIGGFARALSDRLATQPDAKAGHYLNRIVAGAALMEQQIEGLLSLARTVRQPMEWSAVDLTSLARDALEGLHMHEPHRLVDATVQEGMVARGDARLIRTVLQNLLGNAWKFTARRDEAVIEVGCVDEGERVYFVRDNGAGFDMAQIGKLFGPFQRLHSQSDFPGTGIGLASVQRVIARHQGRIWAEAARNQGCTIWFTLSEAPPVALPRPDEPDSAG